MDLLNFNAIVLQTEFLLIEFEATLTLNILYSGEITSVTSKKLIVIT